MFQPNSIKRVHSVKQLSSFYFIIALWCFRSYYQAHIKQLKQLKQTNITSNNQRNSNIKSKKATSTSLLIIKNLWKVKFWELMFYFTHLPGLTGTVSDLDNI